MVEGLVIAVGHELLRGLFVKGAHFVEEVEKGAAAVHEMVDPVLNFSGAKGVDVEANVFAVRAGARAAGEFEQAEIRWP